MRALEVGTQDNTATRYLDSSQNPGAAGSVTYKSLFPDQDGAGGFSACGLCSQPLGECASDAGYDDGSREVGDEESERH